MLGRSQTCGDEKVRGISAPCPQERLRLRAVGSKRRSSADVRRWPQEGFRLWPIQSWLRAQMRSLIAFRPQRGYGERRRVLRLS